MHRSDGKPKPAFPAKAEKDLWFLSDHYMRCIAVGKGKTVVPKYYGVLVGLFCDGRREVKPMDHLVAIRLDSISIQIHFPEETGLPKTLAQ